MTQAARKHRIGSGRVVQVIENCAVSVTFPGEEGQADRTLWLGDDRRGVALEIVTVPLHDGGLLVIHAMVLREKYRSLYEKGEQS